MFFIMCPDVPQVPEAPPARVASFDRTATERPAEVEAAADRVVSLILGERGPHSAYQVADQPTCLTCRTSWPCPATVQLLLSPLRGDAAQAAESTWLGAS